MPRPDLINTYQNPLLSIWQSAVEAVSKTHAAEARALEASAAPPRFDGMAALMAPALFLGKLTKKKKVIPAIEDITKVIASDVTKVEGFIKDFITLTPDCAKTAAKFLGAELAQAQAESDKYADVLLKGPCNAVGWGECVTKYLEYKLQRKSIPYIEKQNFIVTIKDDAKIAIIGDWGTGLGQAINVLHYVKTFDPDILIHLGDVYFAGTQSEVNENFLSICSNILASTPLYSLCGNHDMYSGGAGYYSLLGQIKQGASYFCLQSSNWMFTAMDTGFNDNNPFTVSTNMTALYNNNGWNEADWHLANINKAIQNKQKICVLSHHQLFSPFGPVGNAPNGSPSAINTKLLNAFQSVIPNIDIWFWGHEHTLALYDNYENLKRGRCVGASAIPVFTDEQSYSIASNLFPAGTPAPTWNKNFELGNSDGCYNNAFAIMKLNGSNQASVDYYQVTLDGNLQAYAPTEYI